MYPYRTRFKKEIIAEFFPPRQARSKRRKQERVIILCPGQPGRPSNSAFLEFWPKKGFWTFALRYRGSWESSGRFLRHSPHEDVLDILDDLPRGFTEAFAHRRFKIGKNAKYYIFGNSFGGPAALLAGRDPRVTKVVCASPVVDWRDQIKHGETNSWTEKFTREAFGEAYRFSHKDWKKLDSGKFYNPVAHIPEINGHKTLIIHSKDDKVR